MNTHPFSSAENASPVSSIWGASSFLERTLLVLLCMSALISGAFFLYDATLRMTEVRPAQGGHFTEGIVGTPRFINPLLAQSQADQDLTILMYSGLMRALPDGTIVPDLASSYEVSEDGTVYTVTLRDDAVFHDGKKVTVDDVLFTIMEAQDPALQSPQEEVWLGIRVQALDSRTITFSLSRPYASFLENLTLGILPKHLWGNIPPEEFAAHVLNTEPVGSGPFELDSVSRNGSGIPETYTLSAFDDSTRGRPHMNEIRLRVYGNQKDLISAYLNGDVDSLDSLNPSDAHALQENGADIQEYQLPRVFGIFFNQNKNDVLTKSAVREALSEAIDRQAILNDVLFGFGESLETPLPTHLYTPKNQDTRTPEEHIASAQAILEKAGFEKNEKSGLYEDDGVPLSITLSTANTEELKDVAEKVAKNWRELGVDASVELFDIGQLHHEIIRPRAYEALLFGQVVGRDGDVYPFWHSSQRNDPGLNVALYANIRVDAILENIRATLDPKTRSDLYADFVDEIESDTPAVFLYTPHLLYIAPRNVSGMHVGVVHTPAERFLDVQDWYVRTERIWKFLLN